MITVKNLASSIVSTVSEKVSRIDEVIGDPLLKVTGIKEKENKSKRAKKKGKMDKKDQSTLAKESKTPITWKINKQIYELTETKRKLQMRQCLQVEDLQFEYHYIQHKNSLIRLYSAASNLDKLTVPELKLFNNQLDQLTDYELMEVLKKVSIEDRFKFRRVSKRFRNCINQIIQFETSFALIEKKFKLNFRIDQITNYAIDPIYMKKNDLKPTLIDNINRFMTKLNSIVIAFPIDFNLFLELIRRRNLVNLVLCGPTFADKHMNALPDYTVNLTTLNLDQCVISDKGLEVIVRECGKVLTLRLSNCNQINGTFLEHLPNNFVCLEIGDCNQFKSANWRFLLAKERKQMATFSIENIAFDSHLIESMIKFDKLLSLTIRFKETLDYKFKSISMYTRLEVLKIADCSSTPCFTDQIFNEIQRGCDRLTKIELEFDPTKIYLTDVSFLNLSENCAKVTSIKLINLCNLTEKTLNSLSRLKYLLELTLDNLNFTDYSILKCLPEFRSLKKIKFSNCSNITNYLPEQMFKSFFHRSVWYYLALRSNPKIEPNKLNQTNKPSNLIFEIC